MPSAHPDPPEEPEVLSKSSRSVTLCWHKPLSDGGCDILGYNVERKIPGVGWQSCSEGITHNTEFTVDGLTPGEPYRFRVSAVNKVGASEPLHFPQVVQLGENGEMSPRRTTARCCGPAFRVACLLRPFQASPGRVHSATSSSALLPTQQRRKSLGKTFWAAANKTCCVVSTRYSISLSCLAAYAAPVCGPVTTSFCSGGVWME